MEWSEYRDKILLSLAGIFMIVLGYLTLQVLETPSKDDVAEMIKSSHESSPYMQDRGAIKKSIDDLYMAVTRHSTVLENAKDRIIQNNEKMWQDIGALRLDMERMTVRIQMSLEALQGHQKSEEKRH